MVDWSINEMEYTTIGSFDHKILAEYQPSLENTDTVDEYQTQILLLLFLEGTTKCSMPSLSFQGIKRKLDLHQQILTNALNRLIEKELILKSSSDNHYFLTEKGLEFIQANSSIVENLALNKKIKFPTIEHIYLTDITGDNFLNAFRGKWFGDFRWVGWFQDSNSVKVEWISTDNSVEAVAWHRSSNDSSFPYFIKTIIFQKSPSLPHDEMMKRANKFKSHFNKKLSKLGMIIKDYPLETSNLQQISSENSQWFYQSCIN